MRALAVLVTALATGCGPDLGPALDGYAVWAVSGDGQLLWTYPTEGPIQHGVVVDGGGRIIVASRFHVFALDHTGRQLWSLGEAYQGVSMQPNAGLPVALGPDGHVYVPGGDRLVYVLD